MPNQVLTIEPQNELKFKVDYTGMFELGHTTYMRLINPSTETVLFKIKTTAPKKYCVRPNSGVLEPNSKVEISITPQPVFVDPNEKHKHKFMVQSVIAPEGKTNIDQVWKEISPEQMMDYKLKCIFESPRGTNDAGDNSAQNEVTKKRVAVPEEAKSTAKEAGEGVGHDDVEKQRAEDVVSVAGPDPTNASISKSENFESDLQKVTFELGLLREQESRLKKQNLQLQEEVYRLEAACAAGAGGAGGAGAGRGGHVYAPERAPHAPLLPWLATTLAVALLGIIVGKFLV